MIHLVPYLALSVLAVAVGGAGVTARRQRLLRARLAAVAGRAQPPSRPPVARFTASLSGLVRRPRGRTPAGDPRLPLVADLLAACLAAGAVPSSGAAAVGAALDGPLAEALRQSARELQLGGDPAVAWRRLAEQPGAAPLARRLELADSSGVPAVAAVAAAAAEERAARARRAQTAVRQAGVHITGPLGLCFLPAFLLIGVAPVVIGLAAPLL